MNILHAKNARKNFKKREGKIARDFLLSSGCWIQIAILMHFGGLIWKKIRDSTFLTPQQYEKAIKNARKDVRNNPHLLDISQAFKLKYTYRS